MDTPVGSCLKRVIYPDELSQHRSEMHRSTIKQMQKHRQHSLKDKNHSQHPFQSLVDLSVDITAATWTRVLSALLWWWELESKGGEYCLVTTQFS